MALNMGIAKESNPMMAVKKNAQIVNGRRVNDIPVVRILIMVVT